MLVGDTSVCIMVGTEVRIVVGIGVRILVLGATWLECNCGEVETDEGVATIDVCSMTTGWARQELVIRQSITLVNSLVLSFIGFLAC